MATLPGATCTGQDVVQRLTSDGYVIVSGLMSERDVAAARADLGRVLEATPKGRNHFEGFDTQRVYALFAKTRTFDQIAVHPLLLDVLDRALGHYQLSAPVGIRIGPGEQAQMLHRDDAIYPLPEPHPPVVINTMWPLDEFTEDNGATRLVAGSHRWKPGRQPAPGRPNPDGDHVAGLGHVLPRQPLAWRGRQPHQPAASRGDLGVRRQLAAPAGEPLPCRAPRPRGNSRNGYRNCSATTSTRRSSATSTASIRAGSCGAATDRPADQRGRFASMAETISVSSGSVIGRNRATTFPSGPTRNFSKFHWMSPASPAASGTAVNSS
jgi:Protein involved in biosynthesis of mitomycin antibiotics/polyketide fumonisin